MSIIKIQLDVHVRKDIAELYEKNAKFRAFFQSICDESLNIYGEPDGSLRCIESVLDNDDSLCGNEWLRTKRKQWGLK